MLTSHSAGVNPRQWTFIGLLFIPIFALMFIAGVYVGRSNEVLFPIALVTAIIGTMAAIIVLGLNYRIGVYLIMLLVLWDRVLAFGQGGNLSATKIAIGLTILFTMTAILNNQLPGWWRKLIDPLAIAGILFLIFSFWSVPFMLHPEMSAEFLRRRTSVVALMLILMITITNREVFHRVVLCLIVGGTLVAIATTSEIITGVSLLQRMGRSNPDLQLNVLGGYRGAMRLIGPSGDPTFYSLAQSLPGVLAFGLIFYYREWWKKALLIGALLIIGANIMGTGSRAGALAFLAGGTVVFFTCPIQHRLPKLVVVALVVVIALTAIATSGANVAADRITSPGEASRTLDLRIALWQMALHMFVDNPIVGVGTNGWGPGYFNYKVSGASPTYLRVHNAFMQLLAENGIAGLLSYCALYLFAAISAFSAGLGTMDRRLKFEAMAVASLVFGFFLFAGTSNVLENELYFIVFGLCGASYYVYQNERRGRHALGSDQIVPSHSVREIEWLAARQRAAYPDRV